MLENLFVTLFAYLLDRTFGEYRFIKHPVITIGELISFFEHRFYQPTVLRGLYLVMFVLVISGGVACIVTEYLSLLPSILSAIITPFLASMFIAHSMLRETVLEVTTAQNKHKAISMLVSRDTQNLSESEIYKAAIETYAENLSDGVVAPMLYLLLFGLPGIVIYKAINTMDSMVGYRNEKYEKFGKVAAIVDDIANFFPSRLTAIIIMLAAKQKDIFSFYHDGKKHESPNAGHPITAMALALNIQLGGDTSYFGKLKKKEHFGNGRATITARDVQNALKII
jgi:adenosylcobinamide-phosphate synthase